MRKGQDVRFRGQKKPKITKGRFDSTHLNILHTFLLFIGCMGMEPSFVVSTYGSQFSGFYVVSCQLSRHSEAAYSKQISADGSVFHDVGQYYLTQNQATDSTDIGRGLSI